MKHFDKQDLLDVVMIAIIAAACSMAAVVGFGEVLFQWWTI